MQTDNDLKALVEQPLVRSSAHDRQVRREMLERAKQDPEAGPGREGGVGGVQAWVTVSL